MDSTSDDFGMGTDHSDIEGLDHRFVCIVGANKNEKPVKEKSSMKCYESLYKLADCRIISNL
jgi:hypothetical protein